MIRKVSGKIFPIVFFLLVVCIAPSCSIFNKSGYTEVVKPRRHSKPYNPKKNRYSKRTKKAYKKLGY